MSYKSIKHNPYKIVKMFEEEVCEYTGAPFAVAVDSCTNALFLSLVYMNHMGNLESDVYNVVVSSSSLLINVNYE